MLGITDDHIALHGVARRWVAQHCAPSVPRAYLDAGGATDQLPPFWKDIVELGWLGLHLPEQLGGSGYGLPELAVVLEELGRACAPGPFLPTVIASAVIDAHGTDEQRKQWVPGLADGSLIGGVSLDGEIVLGGASVDVYVFPTPEGWRLADHGLIDVPSVDPTRAVARVDSKHVSAEPVAGDAASIVLALVAAECSGGAEWCVETAAEYACEREQFGRPIGQFQGVKHRCADMLVALEQIRAVAWDAARPVGTEREHALAAAMAATIAPAAFLRCAKDCIQVLGGIGFTWEHDAHLYLKRAMSIAAFTARRGAYRNWPQVVHAFAADGVRRTLDLELPPEAETIRAPIREELAELTSHDKSEWRRLLAEGGFIAPHWPRPWGRDASPLEQLVIDEEMRNFHVRRPHLQVGAWVLPTLIEHGTAEQQQRFIPRTLRGELPWCQLFSEPGAGSDLASLSTRATRTDGGWLITGQKVWTSFARESEWGICLARTDPTVPKHEGITCFLVEMASEGIDIRPLREITGFEMFNEVFFSEVFVPDDCVVGVPGDGWRAGRTTLANERVSMGSGSSFGLGVQMLLALTGENDTAAVIAVGEMLAEAHSLAVMRLRATARAVVGADAGPESSVQKLLTAEHDQRVQELGMLLLGAGAAANDGEAATWIAGFIANRCLTIAGGTSEVQRNVIAERLLGLPRDP